MTYKKLADFIGYTRNGAVVKSFDGVLFNVQCGCGAEFKCGRLKLHDHVTTLLHCNACRHKRLSACGRKSVGLEPK